jgi:hypothetical protein
MQCYQTPIFTYQGPFKGTQVQAKILVYHISILDQYKNPCTFASAYEGIIGISQKLMWAGLYVKAAEVLRPIKKEEKYTASLVVPSTGCDLVRAIPDLLVFREEYAPGDHVDLFLEKFNVKSLF